MKWNWKKDRTWNWIYDRKMEINSNRETRLRKISKPQEIERRDYEKYLRNQEHAFQDNVFKPLLEA